MCPEPHNMDEDETQSAEAMRARDKAWLDRYRGGDINALGELVEHYRRPLFGYILRMTENSSDAEEIFQEVWFKAIRSFESYSDQKFLSWMFRITHNHIIDRARKKKPDFSLDDTGLAEHQQRRLQCRPVVGRNW